MATRFQFDEKFMTIDPVTKTKIFDAGAQEAALKKGEALPPAASLAVGEATAPAPEPKKKK